MTWNNEVPQWKLSSEYKTHLWVVSSSISIQHFEIGRQPATQLYIQTENDKHQ